MVKKYFSCNKDPLIAYLIFNDCLEHSLIRLLYLIQLVILLRTVIYLKKRMMNRKLCFKNLVFLSMKVKLYEAFLLGQ